MQTAGDLVAAVAELAARVQHGQRERDRRDLLLGVQVDREASPVVGHPDAVARQQRHRDQVGVPGQRLVDGVVDDLVDEVVQAPLTGRADVHARALAHRLEAFEHLDGVGPVLVLDLL